MIATALERNCSHCKLLSSVGGVSTCTAGVWDSSEDVRWLAAVESWQETLSPYTRGKAKTRSPMSFYAADCLLYKPRTERYFSKQPDGAMLFRWLHRCAKCQDLHRRLAYCYLCSDLVCSRCRKRFTRKGIHGYICKDSCLSLRGEVDGQ